ncbi:MAG: hypothetical protein COS85_09530 [Armatimonadetes bacterium CG07_land_8_20_14_0_80_59_28]|nr:MAG: hypothetical protein COS85_09530 [Armatimonadetes bacterium CG07_land_8_20_14_0_80_59_28]
MVIFLVVALSVLGSLPVRAVPYGCVIAQGGKPLVCIVKGGAPIASETTATKELADYLGRITGATFPQVAESGVPAKASAIYVGQTAFAAKQGINFSKLGQEEWIIRTIGSNLILAGGRPRGTLYAVYDFLEKQLGCHWLAEDTEVVPRKPTLTLPVLNVRGKPSFGERGITTYLRGVLLTNDGMLRESVFQARNKANDWYTYLGEEYGFNVRAGSPNGCHTFAFYIDPKVHFKEHPEYFSQNVNGQRESVGGQLCLTNPEVLKLVIARLKEFIAKDREAASKEGRPAPTVYDISQNDYHHLCQCANCKVISEREESDSGPLIEFINQVADAVRDEYPEILVQTFAYTCTQKPPKTLKPHDNVMIRLCDLNGELFRPLSHPLNSAFRGYLDRWSQIAKHLSIWDYWITYGDVFHAPYSNIRCLQPDLKMFLDHGVVTMMVEDENPEFHSFFALKRWLGLQLMQNPNQPPQPLIDLFMNGYYGPAARKMQEYLTYLEGCIEADPDRLVELSPFQRKYLDLKFFEKCEQLLGEAEQAVGNDLKLLLHVRRERVPVDSALLNLWGRLQKKLPAGSKLPFDREEVLQRYEANRLAQMEAIRTAVTLPAGKTELSKEMDRLRAGDIPLPEQFRNLPPDSVWDFTWPSFAEYGERRRLVADPEAAGGKTLQYTGDGPKDHERPASFGVYDGARRVFGPSLTLEGAAVPQDEKHHWYKIGRFPVTNGVLLWAHWTWWLSVALDRVYDPTEQDHERDIWVSLKVTGPAYVKDAKQPNAISIDRVVLVRVGTK